MQRFHLKRGDTGPSIAATLTAGDTAVVLTGGTVRFLMREEGATELKVDGVATIVDGPTGQVSYAWEAADTDEAGEFTAEWEATLADGQVVTFPRPGYDMVLIEDDLG